MIKFGDVCHKMIKFGNVCQKMIHLMLSNFKVMVLLEESKVK